MFGFVLKPLRKHFGADREYYRMVDGIFGFVPDNIELYKLALIHRSASFSLGDGRQLNNERLEFLGDAVLEAIVSDFLFLEYRDRDEGFLTQMRSKIVSRSSLNGLSMALGLDRYVVAQSGVGISNKHIYGDTFEAMVAAIYLDKGYDFVNRLLINDIFPRYVDLDDITSTEVDFKSRLIEWCQKSRRTISFETELLEGATPRHPRFRSQVVIDSMELGYGIGDTKKQAEQRAAYSVSEMMSDRVGDSFLDMIDHMEGHSRKCGA